MALNLERHFSADDPGREDQIRVPDGVIGVQVCDKRVLDIGRVQGCDAFLLRSRCSPQHPSTEIYQVRLAIDDDRSRGTRALG
jgi:hypothetical protein